jgi:pyruvate kinase
MIEILATLGPSSLKSDVIQKLSDEGVSLFRINLSHTPLEKIKPTIEIIQKNTKVPISLDTEGAQIRNQSMQNGTVLFKKGEIIKIHYESIVGDENNVSFTPVYIGKTLEVGDYIEIDFHSTAIRVIEKKDTHCIAEVEIGGKVGSNKAVDVDRAVCLEPITEKDKAAIKIGK